MSTAPPDFTVDVQRLPMHPWLGRHIRHDSRSLRYAVGVLPRGAIKPVAWQRQVQVFNQKKLGSCTGNAAAGWLGTDDSVRKGYEHLGDGTPVDETLAIALYSEATKIDPYPGTYPPTDTGSDGLSVTKALKARGLVDTYGHAFSLDALYAGLQAGPVLWGTTWYESMFDTESDGHIKVDLRSGVAGGHEIYFDQLEMDSSGNVQRLWITNSWDTSWGVSGRAYVTPAEVNSIPGADFTVPNAVLVAPPGPAPVPVPPTPTPPAPDGGGCFPVNLDGADSARARHLAAHKYRLKEAPTDQQVGDYLSTRLHSLLD